jgi:hypothetical protein
MLSRAIFALGVIVARLPSLGEGKVVTFPVHNEAASPPVGRAQAPSVPDTLVAVFSPVRAGEWSQDDATALSSFLLSSTKRGATLGQSDGAGVETARTVLVVDAKVSTWAEARQQKHVEPSTW